MTKRRNTDIESSLPKARLTVALCGNPNSGKTTLFNLLTGSNQKVGNWPGVTVEQKTGYYKADKSIAIVDTPGIYSLSPFTIDEKVAHNYLMNGKPDLVVNIIDSTNLERSLFLTTQLLELDLPVVVALNMQDEARQKGIEIDTDALERALGCKFFSISASKGDGIERLIDYCVAKEYQKQIPLRFSQDVEEALGEIARKAQIKSNARWNILKLLENDKTTKKMLNLTDDDFYKEQSAKLTARYKEVTSAVIVEQRYEKIGELVNLCQKNTPQNVKEERATSVTEKIDKIALNKWLAFPVFALIMFLVFYVAMGPFTGGLLTDLINDNVTVWLKNGLAKFLEPAGEVWQSFVCDGIVGGVMGVVGFVPQIMLLFGCIAVLEASGYMSRIAFLTDKLLNKIGLGGRSFVSMVIGCGCSVPAIMSTRTIKNVNERNATITLTPFMPCSAKLAVISFVSGSLFPDNHGTASLVAISFYLLSIVAVITGGLILKVFNRKKTNASDTFVMELPTYRAPTFSSVAKQMWDRGKAFLVKAGTIIFVASVVLWILQNFNIRLQYLGGAQGSMLEGLGRLLAPLFAPLGFGDWRFAIATLTGIAAKETVVATLEVTLGTSTLVQALANNLGNTAVAYVAAYSFVVYNLLTVPCTATISASFSEQGNWKNGVKSIVFQLVTSYVVSLLIFQIGRLAATNTKPFTIGITITVIAFATYFCVRYLVKNKGCNYECDHCPNNEICEKK